ALDGGMAFTDPRLAALGARVLLPAERIPTLLDGPDAGFAAYDRLRLSLGVPDGSRDLVLDKSILLEAGFDELNGVDWQKGCYIAQNRTARTKHGGLIRNPRSPVRPDGPPPNPGPLVTSAGHEAGEIRPSRDDIGLALLRLDAVGSGGALRAGDTAIEPL